MTNTKDITSIAFLKDLKQEDKDTINQIINNNFLVEYKYDNMITLSTKDHSIDIRASPLTLFMIKVYYILLNTQQHIKKIVIKCL